MNKSNPVLRLADYTPLRIRFLEIAVESIAGRVIGSVLCPPRSIHANTEVSLVSTPGGNIFAGDEVAPDQPVQFVNTSLDTLENCIRAHSNYTNDILHRCQLDEREDFESLFANKVAILVAKLGFSDPIALSDREFWWPKTLDAILAGYRWRTC